jgi:tripartite-type tricarboxylate transporter receptor subunit TctC
VPTLGRLDIRSAWARASRFARPTREVKVRTLRESLDLTALTIALTAALGLAAPAPARADPIADFYAGKTVQLIIGYAPGAGYDEYARLLGRHIGRHIPGRPTVVVQNMPGAGSIRAANYLYNVAPKDGTTIGGFARGVFLDPLLGRTEGNRYDAAKFGWLGSITSDAGVCAFRSDAGINSWADMRSKPYKIGGTGAGADSDVFANLLRRMFNLPMQLVLGYQGGAETALALMRREVDGRCGWSLSTLMSVNKDLYLTGQVKVALVLSDKRVREFPDAPTAMEVADNDGQRAILKLAIARQSMARPYVAPPGLPPERLAALRGAFNATMVDPEFLADARRANLEVRPTSGAEADTLIAQVYATSPDIVKRAAEFMKEGQ